MFTLSFKAAKEGFFDRTKVQDSVDSAALQVLSKFGAYVRTRARSSIRRAKKTSSPGQPPRSHVGLLKDLIFFSYDRNAGSVVIGPTLINRPTGAPETLEYGGETDISTNMFRTIGGKRKLVPIKRRVKIAARPYMHPALDKELPGLPAMWYNSVK